MTCCPIRELSSLASQNVRDPVTTANPETLGVSAISIMPLRDSDDDDDYSLGAVPQSPGSSLGHYRSNSLTSSLSTPCGFLVNGQDCIYGLRCVNSHSPDVIAAWTSRRGRMSCKHGPTCELAQRGICLYYHPKSHRTRQSQRDRMMMEGLTGQEIIDIRCPPSGNGTIGISDEEELASFNKLGDDEILVPGPCCQPVALSARGQVLT